MSDEIDVLCRRALESLDSIDTELVRLSSRIVSARTYIMKIREEVKDDISNNR